jgi:hypothetical protein
LYWEVSETSEKARRTFSLEYPMRINYRTGIQIKKEKKKKKELHSTPKTIVQ